MAWLAVVGLGLLSIHRLRFALPHAVRDLEPWSAINVAYRHDELTRWFDGASIYHEAFGRIAYPPASYVMLWPILGWLPYDAGRVLYVVATLVSAAVLGLVVYRVTDRHPLRERLLMVTVFFASYPLQTSVSLGHLMPIQVVAVVAGAVVLLGRQRAGWWTDTAASLCLAAALIKPTLAPPLLAAVLIGTWRWRPVVLTGAIYFAASLLASIAQPAGVIALHLAWLRSSTAYAVNHALGQGVPNLHAWLAMAGVGEWGAAASVLVLAAFCLWAWRCRRADVWLLIGAAALVARLWSYHRPYDDAVIFLAAVALFRMARGPRSGLRTPAGVLCVVACLALLTPAWALYDLAPTTIRLVYAAHTALWLALLGFLLMGMRHDPGSVSPRVAPRW